MDREAWHVAVHGVTKSHTGQSNWTELRWETSLAVHARMVKSLQLCPNLWAVARQVWLSMGFSSQEYWSVLQFPSPGNLPDTGIKPVSPTSPALVGEFFTTSATRKAPSGPVVRILCYHCKEYSSHTWSGNKDPTCCTLWPKKQKWTRKQKKNLDTRWTIRSTCGIPMDFPAGTSGKEPACQCSRCKRWGFDPCVRKIPWRRTWEPTPVFMPEESHGKRNLAVTVHRVAKSRIQLKRLSMPACTHVGYLEWALIQHSKSTKSLWFLTQGCWWPEH